MKNQKNVDELPSQVLVKQKASERETTDDHHHHNIKWIKWISEHHLYSTLSFLISPHPHWVIYQTHWITLLVFIQIEEQAGTTTTTIVWLSVPSETRCLFVGVIVTMKHYPWNTGLCRVQSILCPNLKKFVISFYDVCHVSLITNGNPFLSLFLMYTMEHLMDRSSSHLPEKMETWRRESRLWFLIPPFSIGFLLLSLPIPPVPFCRRRNLVSRQSVLTGHTA